MKISRLEFVTLLLTAAFAAFAAGWFLRGAGSAEPVRVETARTPRDAMVSAPGTSAPPAQSTPAAPVGKVNINTADSDTLQTLPGIGASRAEDIIAYRLEHGPFRRVSDLTQVKGIGAGTLEKLRELITVS